MGEVYISKQKAIETIAGCTNIKDEDELRKYVTDHNLENLWSGGVLNALDAVKDMDAADVAPLVHGEWIHMGCGLFECDKCGEKVLTKVYVSEETSQYFKFCPGCGAKMDEGKKKNE